jgi:F-box domain
MESLSEDIKLEIALYLDILTILTLSQLSKLWNSLIQSPVLWNAKKKLAQVPYPLVSDGYFKYNAKSYYSYLHSKEPFDFTYSTYVDLMIKLNHPRSLVSNPLDSHLNQSLSGMLKYEDDLFWNSKQRADSNTTETILCELIDSSIVFSVHFKIYRAVCQGGILYPSRYIKIYIGNDKESHHYESGLYKVCMSEKYCSIQILPEIVIGKYIKIELIGKVTHLPNSLLYITAIEFFDVIGYSLNSVPLNNLELGIVNKDTETVIEILSRNKHKSTPFIVNLMEKYGILDEVLLNLNRHYNEVESFVYMKDKMNLPVDMAVVKPSEALGDYCFESGAFFKAFYNYSKIMDIWKLSKTAIVLKNADALRYIINKHDPRYPRYADIITISRTLGPEFEDFVRLSIG